MMTDNTTLEDVTNKQTSTPTSCPEGFDAASPASERSGKRKKLFSPTKARDAMDLDKEPAQPPPPPLEELDGAPPPPPPPPFEELDGAPQWLKQASTDVLGESPSSRKDRRTSIAKRRSVLRALGVDESEAEPTESSKSRRSLPPMEATVLEEPTEEQPVPTPLSADIPPALNRERRQVAALAAPHILLAVFFVTDLSLVALLSYAALATIMVNGGRSFFFSPPAAREPIAAVDVEPLVPLVVDGVNAMYALFSDAILCRNGRLGLVGAIGCYTLASCLPFAPGGFSGALLSALTADMLILWHMGSKSALTQQKLTQLFDRGIALLSQLESCIAKWVVGECGGERLFAKWMGGACLLGIWSVTFGLINKRLGRRSNHTFRRHLLSPVSSPLTASSLLASSLPSPSLTPPLLSPRLLSPLSSSPLASRWLSSPPFGQLSHASSLVPVTAQPHHWFHHSRPPRIGKRCPTCLQAVCPGPQEAWCAVCRGLCPVPPPPRHHYAPPPPPRPTTIASLPPKIMPRGVPRTPQSRTPHLFNPCDDLVTISISIRVSPQLAVCPSARGTSCRARHTKQWIDLSMISARGEAEPTKGDDGWESLWTSFCVREGG